MHLRHHFAIGVSQVLTALGNLLEAPAGAVFYDSGGEFQHTWQMRLDSTGQEATAVPQQGSAHTCKVLFSRSEDIHSDKRQECWMGVVMCLKMTDIGVEDRASGLPQRQEQLHS